MRGGLIGCCCAKGNSRFAAHLITPSIRYSKPESQTHIAYLYRMTNSADESRARCDRAVSGVAQ
jgi:hypothetical protein